MRFPRLSTLAAFIMIASMAIFAYAGPGEWDSSYLPAVTGGPVYAMAVQPDNMLLIGGAFNSVDGSSSRGHLARLYSDGTLDPTFLSSAVGGGVEGTVWSLALQSNGSIVIGGDFTYINGSYRYHVARLNANGTVDGSFVPTNAINNSVLAVAVQTNNAVIIGGTFINGQTFPSYNARLNPDGTTDTSFSSIPNGPVYAIAIQPDGRILIGGAFTMVNGATRNHIARLNPDGSLDNTFQNALTGATSNVRCIQIQSNGEILIGGDFTGVDNTSRSYVARLTSAGTLDSGFAASGGASGPVYSMAIQPDGNVLIGGIFTSYTGAGASHVARLYDDGTRDTTFTNFGINNTVESMALQSDGGILIGGLFTTVANTNVPYLARLYGDLYPPEFVRQPVSVNTNVGANVTFTAQVGNPTTTSFQWLKNGVDIPGATDMSYRLFNVQLADAANYSVFVTDAIGGVSSTNALLQVGIPPAIISQPVSLTVTQGQSAVFSVGATGIPLNYFWKFNGAFIPGQTNSLLTFASVDPTNAGTYSCVASNFLGSLASTGAVLTVIYPPVISSQPAPQTVGVGSNFTLSVTAAGYPAIAYQWRTNGMPIAGATATNYSVIAAQTNNSGAYDVVITNSVGSITSIVANVSVVYYPPTISQQPVGGNVIVGSNFVLSASADGTPPFTWQWRTNGTPINGANASSYDINSAQLSDAGAYDVVVSAFAGSVTSSVALVNVGFPPTVLQQPLCLTNTLGGAGSFSCIVTGSLPMNFQWTLDGNPVPGATNSLLTLGNLQPADIGYYALTVTNDFGGTVSSNAALNLTGYPIGVWDGLVAFYPFDGNANDLSGNGLNGSPVNVTYDTNRFGITNSSVQLDGSTSYVGVNYSNLFNFAGNSEFTLAAWFKLNGFGSGSGGIGSLIVKGPASGLTDYGLECPGFGNYVLWAGQDGQYPCVSTNTLELGTWYHGVVTYSNANWQLFLDGVLQVQTNTTYQITQSSGGIAIGREGDSAADYFDGSIDDVFIYNRALSPEEVVSLFLQASPVAPPTPLTLTASLGTGPVFNLSLTGIAGSEYVLQTATNLQPPIQWLPVLTNAADTNGLWQFTDTNLNSSQKFYRIATP
jgi:uncharacterized delta-60 repeat protein